MATATVIKIKELVPSILRHQHYTWQRSVLLGGGLAYAWTEGKWWHTPLIFFAPSAYAGYQTFKARDQIRAFISAPHHNERESPSIYSRQTVGEANNRSSEPTHV